jgi:HKD family nuclease
LASDDYHTLTCFTAFTSKGGVAALTPAIIDAVKRSKKISIVTGIDEKVTYREALEFLLNLPINSYIFHQGSSPIFHPKVYVFEGGKSFRVIIGSSNMTRRGLFQNIESSLLVEGSLQDGAGILLELKNYFEEIFDFESPNLKKINRKLIDELVK